MTSRRIVLATTAAGLLLATAPPLRAQPAVIADPRYPFTLPPLPYGIAANDPHIDPQTMELHHDRHHATYVSNLNAAVKDHPAVAAMPLSAMLARIAELPEAIRAPVRNSGGGHAWHSMFWTVMGGRGGEPGGDLATAVARDFGSFPQMRDQFNRAGAGQFGSGWAAVLVDAEGRLTVGSRPNQDSPLMTGARVLLGNDVWEHAYYLKYQNRRADYLQAWWNVVDWPAVEARYRAARNGTLTV